jgi:hypothetical protein
LQRRNVAIGAVKKNNISFSLSGNSITIPSVVQTKNSNAKIGAQVSSPSSTTKVSKNTKSATTSATTSAVAPKSAVPVTKQIASAVVTSTTTKPIKATPSIAVPKQADKELFALEQSVTDESISDSNMSMLAKLTTDEYFKVSSVLPLHHIFY